MLVTGLRPSQALISLCGCIQGTVSNQTETSDGRDLSSQLKLAWLQTAAKGSTLWDDTVSLSLHPPDEKTEALAAECRGELGTQAAGGSPRPVPVTDIPCDSWVLDAQSQVSTHRGSISSRISCNLF